MSGVRVNGFTLSPDGYGAGPDQSEEIPLGVGGTQLRGWLQSTATVQRMIGESGGETGPDDDIAAAAMDNVGAWILGRIMFGPVRGPWPDHSRRGGWGDDPPYHTPVFTLTS